MKAGLLAGALLNMIAAGGAAQDFQYFRYYRSVGVAAGTGRACALLDAEVFAHAAPSLKDLRLYQVNGATREVPYAITLSAPQEVDSDAARVMNLGRRGGGVDFDLAMPARPYTDVVLDLAGQDFLATAAVTGGKDVRGGRVADRTQTDPTPTDLGQFTLFDLTSQHLSRSTTLHLQESTFPVLHVRLTFSAAPDAAGGAFGPQMVRGAVVPPSREAQSLFTSAAETTEMTQRGRQTVASLVLRERVPVERVAFVLPREYTGNFSRAVRVFDHPVAAPADAGETVGGTIQRVNLVKEGREVHQQQLSVPATLGSNLQSAAAVDVVIENGDDAPLPISAVRLEMRQRQLCFDAPAGEGLEMFYGDLMRAAPEYDYARLYAPAGRASVARLGPEELNPTFRAREDTRPLTERHPNVLWIVLLIVVCVLALIAMRSARHVPR